MQKLLKLYRLCRRSQTSFIYVLLRMIYYRKFHKKILAHQHVTIRGIKNIETPEAITVGIQYTGFSEKRDPTVLNVGGKMIFQGKYSIGRGCRFDIGKNAVVTFGKDGYVNPFTLFVIMHELVVGSGCAISWNCQFLDDDFHELHYEDKRSRPNKIIIGDNVWIGSNCFIYKGTTIPDGCVIAANSVVRGVFQEKNALIAGNPAKVVKRNVHWK